MVIFLTLERADNIQPNLTNTSRFPFSLLQTETGVQMQVLELIVEAEASSLDTAVSPWVSTDLKDACWLENMLRHNKTVMSKEH